MKTVLASALLALLVASSALAAGKKPSESISPNQNGLEGLANALGSCVDIAFSGISNFVEKGHTTGNAMVIQCRGAPAEVLLKILQQQNFEHVRFQNTQGKRLEATFFGQPADKNAQCDWFLDKSGETFCSFVVPSESYLDEIKAGRRPLSDLPIQASLQKKLLGVFARAPASGVLNANTEPSGSPQSEATQSPDAATLSIAPPIGLDAALTAKFKSSFEAQLKVMGFIVVDGEHSSHVTLRPYFVAPSGASKLSFVADFTDSAGKRVHRMSGDEPLSKGLSLADLPTGIIDRIAFRIGSSYCHFARGESAKICNGGEDKKYAAGPPEYVNKTERVSKEVTASDKEAIRQFDACFKKFSVRDKAAAKKVLEDCEGFQKTVATTKDFKDFELKPEEKVALKVALHEVFAFAHYVAGNDDKAVEEAEKALKDGSKSSTPLMVRGAERLKAAKYEDAAKDLAESIKIHDWVYTRELRGEAYYHIDNNQAALADFDTVLENTSIDWPELRIAALEGRAGVYKKMDRSGDAIADYKALAQLDAQNPRWDISIAEVHHRIGHDAEALDAVNRALAISPEDGYALKVRGTIYLESADASLRDPDKAIADLTRAIGKAKANDKDSTDEALARALLHMKLNVGGSPEKFLIKAYAQKRDWKNAIKLSSDLIAGDPKYALAYIDRSSYYQAVGDLPAALSDAQKAVSLYDAEYPDGKNNGAAYSRLAEIYIAQGEIAKGLNYFAEKWTPWMEATNLGWVRTVLPAPKTKEEAEKQAALIQGMREHVPKTEPGLGDSITCTLGETLAPFDPDQAIKVFAKIHDSMDECSYLGEAAIHGRARNLAAQLQAYDSFISRKPNNFDAILKRGYLHLAMGNLDKAAADASELKRIEPGAGDGVALEARIAEARGDYIREVTIGEEMIAKYTRWGMGYNIKARGLLKLGKADLALAAASQALKVPGNQSDPALLLTLARAQRAVGKTDDAWTTYLRLIGSEDAEEFVAAIQFSLKEAGVFKGEIGEAKDAALADAIEVCVKNPSCRLDNDR